MRTRIKICGITRVEDALICAQFGADAIGLVFYDKSPRNVNIAQAKAIVAALPPFVSVVGLFVNASLNTIQTTISQVRLDVLQFHGDETPEFCAQFNLPFYKAVRVNSDTNLLQYCLDYGQAQALLLDAYSDTAFGGTGLTFDWNLIPQNLPKPVILAGGLNVGNVAEAIRKTQPYAVDVSGGVERAKGIKDAAKVAAFMQTVNG
jgi:phosphoribosylanthranilate isomerase